tara:strand:+ start:94 stop:486 length:393 start_codon:yes stop_codon:yes gene_type:complete
MSNQLRVAYVDDDPRLRSLMSEELVDEGVEPQICNTGQDLLDLLDEKQIDLIFLDLMMPVMDGLTCLRHLKQRNVTVPVLVVTAFNDESKRQESLESGATDYILKPDLFERLPEFLDQYLINRRKSAAQE